jgi:beta-glucosidase
VGTGSGAYAEAGGVVTLKAGLENAGLKVNTNLWNWYKTNLAKYGRQKSGGTIGTLFTIGDAAWNQIATNAKTDSTYGDAAIFVLSRSGGEGVDSIIYGGNANDYGDGNYLKLSPTERDVLKNLKLQKDAGVFKRIIVLMNSANQVECEFVDDPQYGIDAFLWVGTFGENGANAIGKILTGEVNPSGKLPDTFWKYHYLNPSQTEPSAFCLIL